MANNSPVQALQVIVTVEELNLLKRRLTSTVTAD